MNECDLYTHYEIELEDMPVDWNTTIVDSLEEVMKVIQYLDIYFDDPDCKGSVKIKRIGMTRSAFKQWQEENLEM